MKKFYKIFLIILLGTNFSSCESWLDVSPRTDIRADVLLSNESGFNDALLGVYSLMTTPTCYGRDLTFGFMDVLAQYYPDVRSSSTHEYYNAAKYQFTEKSEVTRFNNIWSKMYQGVANLNAVLAAIDDKKDIFSTGNYELLKGEALALRAFLHFDVLRMYGPMPSETTAKAIPYIDSYTNVPQPQLNYSEVIDKIIGDLTKAESLMMKVDPYGPNYKTFDMDNLPKLKKYRQNRLNYYAVKALLARVYLYSGNTAKALEYAQSLIGTPGNNTPVEPFTLTTSTSSSNRLFSTEILFGLDVKLMKNQIDAYLGESEVSTTLLSISGSYLNTNSYAIYKTSNAADADFRTAIWFAQTGSGQYKLCKYNDVTTIPLLKLSEMYLIAAECATSLDDQISYLNTIMSHRGLVGVSTSSTASQVAGYIKAEFVREFYGDGQSFFFLKRKGSTTGIISPSSFAVKNYIFPIPEDEIEYGSINK